MRSIRMLAAVTGTLVLASACGDGGGVEPEPNTPPVANFTVPACTINVACTFSDLSTDDAGVTAWSWDVNGDGTADYTTQNAAHTYSAAGTFTVTLTVTDEEGLTSTKTAAVTVAPVAPPPPSNNPPTASFTSDACSGGTCAFTSTSTDADGTITAHAWDFGDPASGAANTSAEINPIHTYSAVTEATDFTVTLTVTDDDGATDVTTGVVTIQPPPPPPSQDCTTTGINVDCVLDITARATVTITLSGVDCELNAQRITLPAPLSKQPFGNVCSRTEGEVYTITASDGTPMVFEAGTQLTVRFTQGTIDEGDPTPEAPSGIVDGSFSTWTLRFDDGGNPINQPGFNDNVVLTVTATPR